MKRVEQHDTGRGDAAEMVTDFEDYISTGSKRLAQTVDPVSLLDSLAHDGQSLAAFGSVAHVERARIVRGLRTIYEASVALFALAAKRESDVRVSVDGVSHEISIPGQHGMCSPSEWKPGFFAACACRDEAALSVLTAVPPEVLNMARASIQLDEFHWLLVPALSALYLRRSSAKELLRVALENALREAEDEDGYRAWHKTNVELALRLAEGDSLHFNDALERALVAHRTFWSRNEERREAPTGFLALAPLGLACLARDRGIPIEVTSEYMPDWIVRRDW